MASLVFYYFKYFSHNSYNNSIGASGMRLLIRGELPHLKFLKLRIIIVILDDCQLNNTGLVVLTKARWPNLC